MLIVIINHKIIYRIDNKFAILEEDNYKDKLGLIIWVLNQKIKLNKLKERFLRKSILKDLTQLLYKTLWIKEYSGEQQAWIRDLDKAIKKMYTIKHYSKENVVEFIKFKLLIHKMIYLDKL